MYNLDSLLCMDVETNALHGYTKMHYAVCQDYRTGEEHVFEDLHNNPEEALRFSELVSRYQHVAGHYFLGFDRDAIVGLTGVDINAACILDTLVVSRLLNFSIKGGHSIEAWGHRLGIPKVGTDITDWETKTENMLLRCKSDVTILREMIRQRFERFLTDPDWTLSIKNEHFIARISREMHKTGLPFNIPKARILYQELEQRVKELDKVIEPAFPPRPEIVRVITPRITKAGTLNQQDFRWAKNREFTKDGDRVILGGYVPDRVPDLSMFDGTPFTLYEIEPFNPGSPRQMVGRLNEFGWKPVEKTDGHKKALRDRKKWKEKKEYYEEFGWKVSEKNLLTLPETAPEGARALAERLSLASRMSSLEEWLGQVRNDGRLHPQFQGIGAWTHRMSHSEPNSANIPSGGVEEDWMTPFQKYVLSVNNRMRELFEAPKGYRQVGTDADGIQMRIFCHLVQDERLREAILTGDKAKGTDIHSLHRSFLGTVCKSRDAAKTFIYAWLLGAGNGQVAHILETTQTQARTAVANFIASYPGLKKFREEQIPRDASRGFFVGLDGRKVACDSEHHMLAGYLQNGEKVIMTMAAELWMTRAREEGIDFHLANFVHDEWQTFVVDDDATVARFQEIQLQSFIDTGEALGLYLPLAGTSDTGYNWRETH